MTAGQTTAPVPLRDSGTGRSPSRKGSLRSAQYRFVISALIVPLALFGVFVASPYLQAMTLAFTDWGGFTAERNFIGLANFERLVNDSSFWRAARNNVVLAVVYPVVTIGLALFFASATNFGGAGRRNARGAVVRGVHGAAFYRVVYFFPQVLSIAIVAVLFQNVYNPTNGILNNLLGLVGLDSLQQVWLGDPKTALGAVIGVMVWAGVGFYFVLFNAAMSGVPAELHEAGLLDGVNRFQAFWHITLPGIRDTVTVAVIHALIVALDGFAVIQIMTVGPGGPDGATDVMALRTYTEAFSYSNYGYAAATGVFLCLLTLTMAGISWAVSRKTGTT